MIVPGPRSEGYANVPRQVLSARSGFVPTDNGTTLSRSFKASRPEVLLPAPIFEGGPSSDRLFGDLTPDGQKFLINTLVSDQSATIEVVVNWQAALKR